MVGTCFLHPCRPFTKPTENRGCQSKESEHLGKEADPPTGPIVSRDAWCADKCRHAWSQKHRNKSILHQRIYVVQTRYAAEAVSKADRRGEDFDRIGRNEPCNRCNGYAYVQIKKNKTCEGHEYECRPNSCTHHT